MSHSFESVVCLIKGGQQSSKRTNLHCNDYKILKVHIVGYCGAHLHVIIIGSDKTTKIKGI